MRQFFGLGCVCVALVVSCDPARETSSAPDDPAAPAVPMGPPFAFTGSLAVARLEHTATLLPDGRVLVAGGLTESSGTGTRSAELYDPVLGVFVPTGEMISPRRRHTATLLSDGRVLLVGGAPGEMPQSPSAAELYDPSSGTFTATGVPVRGRWQHTATLLQDGRVLIVGDESNNGSLDPYRWAELYDPASGTFTRTGEPVWPRVDAQAMLLPDGKVAVIGGYPNGGGEIGRFIEIYDPSKGTFSTHCTLSVRRSEHTATALPDGRVLVTGGWEEPASWEGEAPRSTADVIDLTTCATEVLTLITYRRAHMAAPLGDGSVLVVGGNTGVEAEDGWLAYAERYDPTSGELGPIPASYGEPRWRATATALPDGRVLIAGGAGLFGPLASAVLHE